MPEKTAYKQLAESIGAGESTLILRIFASLIDDNEATLLLAATWLASRAS